MHKNKLDVIMFDASRAGAAFISYVNNNDSKYNIIAVADNDKKNKELNSMGTM